ncbi:MAG: amino acid adenylation domain-containing protein [Bacteroidota bacterium]
MGQSPFPKDIEDFYPLAPMQQGMLFHSLFMPDGTAYVEQVSCVLRGGFDAESFVKAWQHVIARHPVLRTSFVGQGLKEPIQVVHRSVSLDIRRLDYRDVSADDRRARLRELRLNDCSRGFDLSKAPLMRFTLVRLDRDAYHFTWTYHHILLDGWSVPMLLEEVFALYGAFRRGLSIELPRRRPFRDYIVWLRKQDVYSAESFWRSALAGFSTPTPVAIASDFEGTTQTEEQSAAQDLLISSKTTGQLLTLTRSNQLTMNTVMQGIWALQLSRYSGEDDVLFGATVSGRPPGLAGADNMIGLFINTLPVRARLSTGIPFVTWLKGIQDQQVDMRQFEYTPLVDIQRWSDVRPGTPLFESILVFESFPVKAAMGVGSGDLEISEIETREETNYPFTVVGGPGEQLLVRIVYDPLRFAPATVRKVLAHFQTVCEQLVLRPQANVDAFTLLSNEERQETVVRWNATDRSDPSGLFVHEMIEQIASDSPHAVALMFQNEGISYGELNGRANRFAHRLRSLGVGPEVVVGICLESSFDMIVAALAVLKAGGAYLPLDPAYPVDRLRFMLTDAGIRMLVVSAGSSPLGEVAGIDLLQMDDDQMEMSAEAEQNLPRSCFAENLAYMIYTSGSTGRPKGSLLTHTGFMNLITTYLREFNVDEQSRVLNFFSFSFDGSVATIFTTLAGGGTLVLLTREQLMSLQEMRRSLEDFGITHIFMTPSVLALTSCDGLPKVVMAIAGGEACPMEVAQKWAHGRSFINAYGPTETTVVASHCHVDGESNGGAIVPIGRPLDNTRIYILDQALHPVPIGVAGELFIGGAGVGRGYLNRVPLTAEKFLPDPFCAQAGRRMYRTGDLGRFLPNGNIEFLGRIDDQVKIRGYRIELGEIESVLLQSSDVAEAAAIVREDIPGDRRVVAYVVAEKDAALSVDTLLASVREKLPSYMIPSAVMVLSRLPLTPNGKIDRHALPAPDGSSTEPSHQYVGPRDSVEEKLIQLWEQVLQRRPIGIEDNFFELGGHSFLAIRLLAQIRQEFGKEVSMVSLFQNPTVSQFAPLLVRDDDENGSDLLVELRGGETAQPLFFIHPTGGSVHWYAELAKCLGEGRAVYGIQAMGLDGKEPPDISIEQMASRYVDAILQKQPEGPYFIGGWSLGVIIAYEVARRLLTNGHPVGMLAVLDQGPRIPIARDPEDDAELLVDIFSQSFPLDLTDLRRLGPDEQYRVVLHKAKKAGLLPHLLRLQNFKQYIQMNRTQSHAWREYVPRPYPGTIWLLKAIESESGMDLEPDMGWGSLALGGVGIEEVPGDHLSMMQNPHVRVLAQHLTKIMGDARVSTAEVAREAGLTPRSWNS